MPIKRRVPREEKVSRVPRVEEAAESVKEIAAKSSSKTKIGIIVVLLVILAIFLFMKGFIVAATVNNQPIFRWSLIQTLEKQGGKKTLDSLVNQTLILQAAKKKNVTVTEEEVNQEITTLTDDLKKQGQDLNTALASQGMVLSDLKEQIKLQKTVEKLLAEKVKITDVETKDFIEKNKSYFPENTPQAEMEKAARQQLSQQKIQDVYTTWIESLRKDAKVNYFLQF